MGSYKIDLIMMHDYICRFNIIKCVRLKNLHEKYVCDNCFNCKWRKQATYTCVQAHHLEIEQLQNSILSIVTNTFSTCNKFSVHEFYDRYFNETNILYQILKTLQSFQNCQICELSFDNINLIWFRKLSYLYNKLNAKSKCNRHTEYTKR